MGDMGLEEFIHWKEQQRQFTVVNTRAPMVLT